MSSGDLSVTCRAIGAEPTPEEVVSVRWNSVSHVRMRAPRGQALRHVVKNHDTCTAVPPSRTGISCRSGEAGCPAQGSAQPGISPFHQRAPHDHGAPAAHPGPGLSHTPDPKCCHHGPSPPAARSHGPAPRPGHSHQGARSCMCAPTSPTHGTRWIAHFCAPMFVFLAGAQRLNDGHDRRELPLARDTRLKCCCPSPGVRHPSRHWP